MFCEITFGSEVGFRPDDRSHLIEYIFHLSYQRELGAHIRNTSGKSFSGKIIYELYDRDDKRVLSKETGLSVSKDLAKQISCKVTVETPHLWSPDSPYLYKLHIYIKDKAGNTIDGYYRRIDRKSVV